MVSPEKFVLLDSDTFTWVLNAIVSDALFNGNKVGNGTLHLKKYQTFSQGIYIKDVNNSKPTKIDFSLSRFGLD